MFVYLLITLELGILYTVFWYLFIRDPKPARRIAGTTWGSYNQSATTSGINHGFASCAQCYVEGAQHAHQSAVMPFMVPVQDEMTLDESTNHYVPLPRKRPNMLAAMIRQFDDCFSELNVKP